MTTITIADAISFADAKPRRTTDGYLVADARVARTGIQRYLGSELGRPDMLFVDVYRPPEVVFSDVAITSYAHRPMTNDHKGEITADNWKQYAIGNTGGEVVRDGQFVRVPLVLMDAAAIADWEGGKRELSMGYSAEITFEDGTTPEGETYHAKITSMRMNHLALVDTARGGAELRIGDKQGAPGSNQTQPPANNGGHHMADNLKTIMVDGISIQTTEQGEQALRKVQGQLADASVKLQAVTDAHAQELARKDAEIDALKSKVLTDADIDARAAKRADLLATARLMMPDADFTGKPDAEVQRMCVAAKLGDTAIAGKEPAYIAVRFDILAEDSRKVDPVARGLQQGHQQQQHQVADHGQAAYEQRTANAWRTAGSTKA